MPQPTRPADLYLVSSSLHFFWAWLLASKHQPQRDAHLWLIDQYTDQPLAFTNLLHQADTPFRTTKLWAGRELKGWQKYQQRKRDFNQAQNMLKELQFEQVFIGNDRSVFGQYVLRMLKQAQQPQNSSSEQAIALDDGVFSYLGRSASKCWHERFIDQGLKKLSYGLWYDSPSTIGASKWINQAWLMYPSYAHSELQAKSPQNLALAREDLNSFAPIAQRLIHMHAKLLVETNAPDVLIALPNHNLIKTTPDYLSRLTQLIKQLQQQNKRIAVKYHPAAQGKDKLNIVAQFGVQCINDQLSFEVLLSLWQDQAVEFIGDLSTTTLLAHYFGFNSQWLAGVQTQHTQAMQGFCQALGIKQVELDD
ncbi:hypothetical protein THIAE_04170 [Thiomicrospira aerophila AL3]|uniref:Capsular polysaccharide biosynthesis protein n=1 Tax=Thiomicrospira aerophila AL3 TaxID=717772 RepID=W0DR49_9GAMM|nr:hypothetical protein [Thiomicrospira aerophila]AHF01100.1 hypothetical protein THIAE_04170 [Thiomicrospira aerophila AL3]